MAIYENNIECEDCNGEGRVYDGQCGDGCCYYYDTCQTCDGAGEVPKIQEEN